MKRGAVKHWVEIIAGIIIVIIIIFIAVLAFGQIIGVAEDATAMASFDSFTSTMSTAASSGTQSLASWSLATSKSDYVYSILYLTKASANKIKNDHNLDSASLYFIDACSNEEACLCLIGTSIYTNFNFNAIVVDSSSDYDTEVENIKHWGFEFPDNNVFKSLKVLSCSNVPCTWKDTDGIDKPCTLYYDGAPLVWLSAKRDKPLKFESLIMNKPQTSNQFYVSLSTVGGSVINSKINCVYGITSCLGGYKLLNEYYDRNAGADGETVPEFGEVISKVKCGTTEIQLDQPMDIKPFQTLTYTTAETFGCSIEGAAGIPLCTGFWAACPTKSYNYWLWGDEVHREGSQGIEYKADYPQMLRDICSCEGETEPTSCYYEAFTAANPTTFYYGKGAVAHDWNCDN